jgi:hypothetical protein
MIITTFRSVGRAYVDQTIDDSWSNIADLLSTHIDSASKQSTPMFNMVEFLPADATGVEQGRRYHGQMIDGQWCRSREGTWDSIPNTVRRCRANVVAVSGIVLDIDDHMTIPQAQELYQDIEYVLYTTFSHTSQRHKFRMVIPFSQPLLSADIAGRQKSIQATFPGVDQASFTVSQSFYFHSGPTDSHSYWNTGLVIDPYSFEYQAPPPGPVVTARDTTMTAQTTQAYKTAVIDSLNTCSGLHYAGANGSNHAVLTLVSLCRSVDMTFEEFDAVCGRMAHPESQLTQTAVRIAAWTGWPGTRLTREKRDEFIRAYGGQPVRIQHHARLQQFYNEKYEIELLESIIQKRKKQT